MVCGTVGLSGYDVTLGDDDDRFESGGYEGTARGGPGADTLVGGGGRDAFFGDDGADNLTGAGERDALDGGAGDDSMTGGEDDDQLPGGLGDDRLVAGFSNVRDADTVSGGPGEDEVDYAGTCIPRPVSSAGVTVDLDGVADDGQAGKADNVLTDVEHITGSTGDDRLTGSAADNVVDPGWGADVVAGGAGADVLDLRMRGRAMTVDLDQGLAEGWVTPVDYARTTLTGIEDAWTGAGDDTLIGNTEANWLDGGPGADVLLGNLGPDWLAGGDDYDAVSYEDRSASVTADLDGAQGDDGAAGEGDTIAADVEDLHGGEGADALTGDEFDNALFGGAGADTLVAGAGDDYVDGEAGADDVTGGAGADTLAPVDGERDSASCGDGRDDGSADDLDALAGDCEAFDRAATPRPSAPVTTVPATNPPTPLRPAPLDRRAPVLTARASAQRRAAVRKLGLTLSLRSDERCSAEVRVAISARDARRAGLKPRGSRPLQIGRTVRTLSAAGRRRCESSSRRKPPSAP